MKPTHVYGYKGKTEVLYMGTSYTWLPLFEGETTAKSPQQATSFLIYRAKIEGLKKGLNLSNRAKIKLSGKVYLKQE